jgi:hypothetical protein
MKTIAGALAACALLVGSIQPAGAGQRVPRNVAPSQKVTLTQQVAQELASSQYQERADNPTLAVKEQGHNAMILKQRGTGACERGWRDAVHQSAWFGKLAKCWRFASAERVEVCPITAGSVGKQSCIEIQKALFTTRDGRWNN